MRLLRRAITVPVTPALMSGVLVVWPVLLAIGGVAGLMARSSLPVRTLGVVMAYAVLELRAMWKLLRPCKCNASSRTAVRRGAQQA